MSKNNTSENVSILNQRTYQPKRPPLRGGLIGFGNVAAQAHLPMWRECPDFDIVAVMEPCAERVRLAAAALPHAPVYSTIEAMLAEADLDFVDICTPPCFHAGLAVAACRAGVHVFCEKPLVTGIDQTHALHRAVQDSGCVVYTVNNWQYSPQWMRVRDLIEENAIGSVKSVALQVLRPPGSGGGLSDWRRTPDLAGGGILLDHGWHHIYLLMMIMGCSPLAVSARMEPLSEEHPGIEGTVQLTASFPNAEATLFLTWQAAGRSNFGTIAGDRGTLHVNDDHIVLSHGNGKEVHYDFSEPLSRGSHHLEWMRPVVDGFRRELNEPEQRGKNLSEAMVCAQITHLAYQSHSEGARFLAVPALPTGH